MSKKKSIEVAPGIFVSAGRISQLRYPERMKARQQVRSAVKSGRLVPQACRVCGRTPTEAHHKDYEKPLNVQWLCREHHVEADKALQRPRRRDRDFVYATKPELHRAGAALGRKGGKARAKKYSKAS